MKQSIHKIAYNDNEFTNVLKVELDSFKDLDFLNSEYDISIFDRICNLYENFTVKKYPNVFGTLVMFTLPENIEIPFDNYDEKYGNMFTDFSIVKVGFLNGLRLKSNEISFKNDKTKEFFNYLKDNGYLRIVKGNLHTITILPIGRKLGYLSKGNNYKLKVNSNFFVMDKWDCSSVFDEIGSSIGLCVKDGCVYNPPVSNRQALIVKSGKVSIDFIDMNDVSIKVDGYVFDKDNCLIYTRPEYRRTKKGGFDIFVVGNRIVGTKLGGNSKTLSSGFVIHLDKKIDIKNLEVEYLGLEDVEFAIQVGNSSIINGIETKEFMSKFYNVYKPWTTSYAPSLYPLNYESARAPRIILGADIDNKPILLWIEGAGKFGHNPKTDSVGASLLECAKISKQLGLYNAINLDGGGSAQILIDNKKSLKISDRDYKTYLEAERGIGLGLYVE